MMKNLHFIQTQGDFYWTIITMFMYCIYTGTQCYAIIHAMCYNDIQDKEIKPYFYMNY